MTPRLHATPDISNQINHAKALLQARNLVQAEDVLKSALEKSGKHPEALGLLAKIVYLRDDKKLARTLWKRALKESGEFMVFYVNMHAFLSILHIEDNLTAANKHAAMRQPAWPANFIPDEGERDLLIAVADLIAKSGQLQQALTLLEATSTKRPEDVEVKASIGILLMLLERHAEALQILTEVDRAIQPRSDLSLLVRIYQCAGILNNEALMISTTQRAMEEHPNRIAASTPGQSLNILIVYGSLKLADTIRPEVGSQFNGNYPSQLAEKLADKVRFSFIFSDTQDSRDSKNDLPVPDLIINNNANAESLVAKGNFTDIAEFIDSFNRPVINHPRKALSASRDQTIKLIADIDGVIAPDTMLFSQRRQSRTDLVRQIESHFDYPMIIRSLTFQEGKGMLVVNDTNALTEALADKPDEFYITQFVESRHEGLFRKIRAAIVGDEVHIVRVDHSPDWKVHGRMTKAPERIRFYQDNPRLLEIEEEICADPVKHLGAAAMQKISAIGKRIPLEILGIDFDVDSDGNILFFEANATMNLLSSADPSMSHPVAAEERLLASFMRYFTAMATHSN